MRRLNFQLKQLCKQNRDGSYGTQVQRERVLTLMANQLHELGYTQMYASSLKPKHVEALARHWLESEVAAGTMKKPHVGASLVGWQGQQTARGGPFPTITMVCRAGSMRTAPTKRSILKRRNWTE